MSKKIGVVNRAIRQENLREQLSAQGHVQHVVDNMEKMIALSVTDDNFRNSLDKYKAVNDTKLKLINKYLPDLKSTELSNKNDEAFKLDGKWKIEVVG